MLPKGRLTSTGMYFVRLVVSRLIVAHFTVCNFSFRWEILTDVLLLYVPLPFSDDLG